MPGVSGVSAAFQKQAKPVLLTRVITALILLPLVVSAIVFLPTPGLYLLFSVIGLLGAWEWSALMGLEARSKRAAYVAIVAVALAAAWVAEDVFHEGFWVLIVGALWWLRTLNFLPGFPGNFARNPWGPVRMGGAGVLMLVPALLGLAELHGARNGIARIFFLFALVWLTDIGAYFVGRAFGRRKLAPNISPGKTVEGAIGGVVVALPVAATAPWVFGFGRFDWTPMLVICVVVIGVSILGDLTESLFKRLRGVKDSGTLLPGHGGVLDRIDSVLAAAPVLALGLKLFGI